MPSDQVIPPSDDVSVCEPVSKFDPPLRASDKSARSKPVTGLLKTIAMLLTELLRGSGVTAVIAPVSEVVSVVHESLALPASVFPAASTMLEPLAVSVTT